MIVNRIVDLIIHIITDMIVHVIADITLHIVDMTVHILVDIIVHIIVDMHDRRHDSIHNKINQAYLTGGPCGHFFFCSLWSYHEV